MDPISLLAGIIIGLIPAAAVELSLKPRRTRSNVAKVLRVEVALNLKLLGLQSAYRLRQPRAIPADFNLSKTAFEAVAGEIGELEGELLGEVLLIYRKFDYLLEVSQLFGDLVDQRFLAEEGSRGQADIERHLDTALEAFNRNLDGTIDHANRVLPRLDKAAFTRPPWYKGTIMSAEELDAKVDEVARLREDNLRVLREQRARTQSGRPSA